MTATVPAMPAPPAWTAQEPADAYHARSKSGECMSSGMLKKFRDCPYAYREAILGNVPDRDSTAYRFGRAVHTIVLEGIPAFNRAYAIGGPTNPKTGKAYGVGTQAHDAWLAANGYSREQVINDDEAETLVTMANTVRRHPEAAALLDFGWPELVARADLHGVPCQIRMDWLTHDADGRLCIVDLKTCDDISYFESDAKRYGYPHQFAFYRDVCQAVTGQPAAVSVIVAEKKAPFRVGVWGMPEEVLDLYSTLNRQYLGKYLECRMSGVWPTGYEEPRVFSLPA